MARKKNDRIVMVHRDGRNAVADTVARRVALEYDGFREATEKQAADIARSQGAVAPKANATSQVTTAQ